MSCDLAAGDPRYSRVRLHPRGHTSAVTTATSNNGREVVSTNNSTASGAGMDYDLPSNSRKLQSLNLSQDKTSAMSSSPSSVTSTTPSQLNYAKLVFTKETSMLRSGVTLAQHQRGSVCSSTQPEFDDEGDEQGGGSEGVGGGRWSGSSGEDDKDPGNK